MASRTRSSSSLSKNKAQFFVISAVTIVVLLFTVSQWIQPNTIPDPSSIVLGEETFVLGNIKDKSQATITGSKTCNDLGFNLDEYATFVQKFVAEKNLNLFFNYSASPCFDEPPIFPTVVNFVVVVSSPSGKAASNFTHVWPR